MESIREWQAAIHQLSVSKGWWEEVQTRDIGTFDVLGKLCLIHSEVSEATEDARVTPPHHLKIAEVLPDGKPVGFPTELADVVIRCFDLAEKLGVDLQAAIEAKHAYNQTRPHRHGGKLA